MFSSISWTDFIVIISTATLLYYFVIVSLYFRRDIIAAIEKYRTMHSNSQPPQDDPGYLEILLDRTMIVCDQIRTCLQEAGIEKTEKEICVNELKVIVGQFMMLKDTPFMVTINNLILKESERNNITFLPVEEVDALWVKAG